MPNGNRIAFFPTPGRVWINSEYSNISLDLTEDSCSPHTSMHPNLVRLPGFPAWWARPT